MEGHIAEIARRVLRNFHGSIELVGRLSRLECEDPATKVCTKVVGATSIFEVDIVEGHVGDWLQMKGRRESTLFSGLGLG